MRRAGTPTYIPSGSQLCVTTAPAPMTQPAPISTPGSMIAPAPIQEPSPTVMGAWMFGWPARWKLPPTVWLPVRNIV